MSEPKKKQKTQLTNRQFSKQDKAFQQACLKVGIEASPRQASKYRREMGKAYTEGK